MWSIKYFEEVYKRFQSSGLSARDFCHNECIAEAKFYYWKRKLKEQTQQEDQQPGFVPIVFSGSTAQLQAVNTVQQKTIPEHMPPCDENVFEIVYPNGVKLRVPVGADLTHLRTLILLFQ